MISKDRIFLNQDCGRVMSGKERDQELRFEDVQPASRSQMEVSRFLRTQVSENQGSGRNFKNLLKITY